jgi:hypothetical protein
MLQIRLNNTIINIADKYRGKRISRKQILADRIE